ncbi:MAG: IPT/TIG domain-containing protein [Mangrovibacterium sp.]
MKKNYIKSRKGTILTLTAFVCLLIMSCQDGNTTVNVEELNKSTAAPYDPNSSVEITSFLPESGGVGQRLVIYGKNFGNDPSLIHVFIGGIEAVVVGVEGESLYCLVPGKAYTGEIEIYIDDASEPNAVAETVFDYQRKVVVSTLCGYKNERDDQGWIDGKFDKVAGFRESSYMAIDPLNPKHVYIAYDFGPGIYLMNMEDSTVTQHMTSAAGNMNRLRSVEFTKDGNYMVVTNDQWDVNGISSAIMSRTNNFKDPQTLTTSRACNGASMHPVNGEMYLNGYEKGEFYRYDIENSKPIVGASGLAPNAWETLFLIQDNGWEFRIHIHPTGNYAYIVVVNKHYILRTDYNWDTKRFTQPYLICGEPGANAWVDGVGSKARLNSPYQGVFVKNPNYAGTNDEYDFYFTERDNHDIRILTPQGKVTTFAGRGSSSINSNPYGYIDGDLRLEARFDQPSGIVYVESEEAFYIMDRENRRMRKIALEQ